MKAAYGIAKRVEILAAALLCAGMAFAPIEARSAGVAWQGSEMVQAAKPDQEILLYFRMDSSALCKELDEDVWSDATIAADAKGFSPVRVDVQSAEGRKIAMQYKVYRVPTIVVAKRDGTIIRRLDQTSDKAAVAKFLRGTSAPSAGAAGSVAPFSTVSPGGGAAQSTTAAGASIAEGTDAAGDATPATRDITGVKVRKSPTGYEVEIELSGAPGKDALSNYSVFLNTDNSTATGFINAKPLGAEWMVEGITVFKFSGAKQDVWGWEQKGTVEARIDGKSVIYLLPAKDFGGFAQGVSLFAGTHDEKWNAVDWAPEDAALVVGSAGSVAVVAPAAAVAPAQAPAAASVPGAGKTTTDATGDGTADHDILSVDVDGAGDPISISFTLSKPPSDGVLHIFVDPDNNPSTGYSDGARSGGDLMIEGSTLYRHTLPGWNWSPIGEISPKTQGNRVTYTIARSRIGLEAGRPANLWFCISDKTWKPVDFVPDSGTLSIP